MELGLRCYLGAYNNKGEYTPPTPVAPVNTVAPVVSGSPYPSSALTCTTGTWTGFPAPTFSYQWQNGDVDISGATEHTYDIPETGSVDDVITCVVTATNTGGSSDATSNAITIVEEPAPSENPFDDVYDPGFVLTSLSNDAVPSMSKPAKVPDLTAPSYTDATYDTKIWRFTDIAEVAGATNLRHDYSRRDCFNADMTKAIMFYNNDGSTILYDAQTFEVIRPLPSGTGSEPLFHPLDPDVMYYTGNFGGTIWYRYNISTDTSTAVADLEALCPEWPLATEYWTKGEGCLSADGRYIGLMAAHYEGSPVYDTTIYGICCLDLATGEVVGKLDAADFPTPNALPDHISISPSGTYVAPSWGTGQGGTRAYTRDFSTNHMVHDGSEHSDLCIGPDGEDFYVFADYNGGSEDEGWVVAVNMATLDKFRLPVELYYDPDMATAIHISGKAFEKPGWVVLSTYADYSAGGSSWSQQAIFNKVFLCEIAPLGRVFNIAHTQHVHVAPNNDYFLEPQATSSKDLTRIVFCSGMGGATPESYMVGLPSWAVPTASSSEAAPVITLHPQSETIVDGDTVTLTVAASGMPTPTYQWQVNSGSGWSDISGETTTSFTSDALALADTGIQYRAVATNTIGTATSNASTVTVQEVAPPVDLGIGVYGIGDFADGPYPYEIAEVTLNTQSDGSSAFLVYGLNEAGHPGSVSVTDNKGNTYTQLSGSQGAGNADRSYVFFSPGGTGGTGHIFTYHAAAGVVSYPGIFVVEITGENLEVDQYADNLDTAAPLDTPTITTTTDGQIVVAFTGGRTDGAITVASPFTVLASSIDSSGAGPAGYYTGAIAYTEQATAGAISTTFTQAGNTYALNHIVSIKQA